jgi:hypothetical protein
MIAGWLTLLKLSESPSPCFLAQQLNLSAFHRNGLTAEGFPQM